jgi:general secretion pathway protein K
MLMGSQERLPNGMARYHDPEIPFMKMFFPTGEAVVEVIPETSKLGVNTAEPPELMRLMLALGLDPEAAAAVTAGILDWRQPADRITPFDAFYLTRSPSFRARHASMEQIEELLMVRGVTPELFYGRYDRTPEGTLAPRSGLRDCLTTYSTYGLGNGIDINTADPAVLLAVGVPPAGVEAILSFRRMGPIREPQMNMLGALLGGAIGRLRRGGDGVVTLRSTARLNLPDGRLSDLRRTVSAVVRFNRFGSAERYSIMRWRDHDPVERLTWDVWTR